jgi:hypothetical protein
MYADQQAQSGADAAGASAGAGEDDAVDAEFEEVQEDDK